MEIPECEMTKGQFLAGKVCANREEAIAYCAGIKERKARWLIGPKKARQWLVMVDGKTVLPTVPKFLRAGRNVSW